MVGYRNCDPVAHLANTDIIRHSDGGVSELNDGCSRLVMRHYQAFRWWGIGTGNVVGNIAAATLSGIPMVGYRNETPDMTVPVHDIIRHSDGGVSELDEGELDELFRHYQAFRWWGIGTQSRLHLRMKHDIIRHSDGGVSEHQYRTG